MTKPSQSCSSLEESRYERLLDNALQGQWSADSDIDWTLSVESSRAPRRLIIKTVSQLLHGERATEAVCHQLLPTLEGPAARRCLELQIIDESRHALAYERCLERLGKVATPDPTFASALESGITWPDQGGQSHVGTVLAYHVVLEGEALNTQQDLAAKLGCPLLDSIHRRAARDEARHVAFGRLYLDAHMPAVEREERDAIFAWLKTIWSDCARGTLAGLGVYRVFLHSRVEAHLTAAWQRHLRSFAKLGLIDRARLERELVRVLL